ncbi:uncharacterized protein LOC129581385 [Paramacrobiotus metropolitanus]|uniref:uncharacterized protein LOC129581385 n=1 Tax=Paramacrobiotus metropolitanus TaxID=2943436 RepID=UPI002445CD6B|nr:uncharacterized protein LOC129581385 [Paramacrobiotus metropolitanus]
MKAHHAYLVILSALALIAAVHGEVTWYNISGVQFLDPVDVCGNLNDSILAVLKMEKSAVCEQLRSLRARQFARDWDRLIQLLEDAASLNSTPQSLPTVNGNNPTPIHRGPRWWMEPWYRRVIPVLQLMYEVYPLPMTILMIVGLACLSFCLLTACEDLLNAMDECVGFEKIKLLLKCLTIIALMTLAFNVLMQFTYIVLTLAEIYVENR